MDEKKCHSLWLLPVYHRPPTRMHKSAFCLFIRGDKMINFHSKESSTSFSYPPRGWFLCFHLDFYSTLYNKWIRALSPVTDSFYDHSGWWDKQGASTWMFAECCADNGEGERWKILISPKYPQQKAIIASTLILALSHPGALFLLHGRPTKRPKYHTGTRKTQIITAELLLAKSHKESVPSDKFTWDSYRWYFVQLFKW